MENIVITQSSKKLREIARSSLQGHWKEMSLGIFIYYILSSVVGQILDCFFVATESVGVLTNSYDLNFYYASEIYEFLVTGALQVGIAMFLLSYFRKHTVDYALTFEGFNAFGKSFILFLVYGIRIFLWSLLFVVPGIIAAFRYSQAFYLRADHPDWSASQCLSESSRLMQGNKAKFFGLELSFIGWYILSGIVVSLFSLIDCSGLSLVALTVVSSIPALIVDVYVMTTETAFYEILTGNLVVQEENPFTREEI